MKSSSAFKEGILFFFAVAFFVIIRKSRIYKGGFSHDWKPASVSTNEQMSDCLSFRSFCHEFKIAVIEYAPMDEIQDLVNEANILRWKGK